MAYGVNNLEENKKLLELLRNLEDNVVRDETLLDIKNYPKIASWRQAYLDFWNQSK